MFFELGCKGFGLDLVLFEIGLVEVYNLRLGVRGLV